MSLKSGILIFIGLVLLAGIGLVFFFWYESQSGEDLTLALRVPDNVFVGAPFEIGVEIRNDSSSILKDVKLTLEAPRGVVFVGSVNEQGIPAKPLGDLGVGGLTEETFMVMAIEGENSIKQLKALVSYQPGSLGSRFEKEATADVRIGEQAMRLELTAPTKTFSGEEIELTIAYQNVSGVEFSGLELQAEYPPVFSVTEASPKPDFDNRIWNLGNVQHSGKNEHTVKGVIAGPEGSFYSFRVSLAASFLGRLYTVSEKTVAVTITTSPLSLEILPNDNPDYIARPGEGITYRLNYRNNTETGLRDVIVKAKLIGVLFDIPTVSSNGFLRSPENTVVWTAANTPELALLQPSAGGSVTFSVGLMPEYPIRRLSDKNFVLKVEAEIESPTVPPFVGAKKTIGKAMAETKVRGDFRIDARGYFRDAASGIANRGPMPPVVGQATQFTMHWVLWNYGTDISGIELRSALGGNVRFTGVVKSNNGILPVFNDRTQMIEWNVDKIIATKGISDNRPVEAIFQVELTPGENQIGSTPVLLQNTTARATDDFTGIELSANDGEVRTNSPDDPSVSDGNVLAN